MIIKLVVVVVLYMLAHYHDLKGDLNRRRLWFS